MNHFELRIGNYILPAHDLDGAFHKVERLEVDSINGYIPGWYSPIHISPEILEACGTVEGRCFYIKKDDFKVVFILWKDLVDGKYIFECGSSKLEIISLHELQNLYFALTGSELMIDEQKLSQQKINHE